MIVAAPKTPQPMLMTASLILNLNKAATNAPVHAPVPGRGMRHNSQKRNFINYTVCRCGFQVKEVCRIAWLTTSMDFFTIM